MSRISPAPWTNDGYYLFDAEGIQIADFDRKYGTSEEDCANARLSAAAPELLSMVKELADELRKHEKWCARDPELCRKCGKEETCLIIKADELIAEAEGSAK